MKRIVKMLACMILPVILVSCAKYELVGKVEATVANKEHKECYVTMVPICTGKTISVIPQTHPEEYNVELKYKDMVTTINNKDIYNKVKVGDKVKVSHYVSEDKKKEKIRYGGKCNE